MVVDQEALCAYLSSHLAHVLDQMLTAATTWAGCHPDRGDCLPLDLVVMAEYSAFVHQRCLYELVGEPKKGNAFRRAAFGSSAQIRSDLHNRWYGHLNAAVAHVYSRGKAAAPVVDGQHLKDQVTVLTADLFSLFRSLEPRMPEASGRVLGHALDRAQAKSSIVGSRLAVPSIEWGADDPFARWGAHKWWP
jgi:hypothetical protein